MKYYLPSHIDGGNRGCEAITQGTATMLGCSKGQLIAYSTNTSLDIFLGIDKYATLVSSSPLMVKVYYLLTKLSYHIPNNWRWPLRKCIYRMQYKSLIKDIVKNQGTMLSTGGDMMCYDNNEVIYINDVLREKGMDTVLWGCSIGEKNLNPIKIEALKKFSCIYARESLTAELMKSIGVKNVKLLPDPAFILNPQTCAIPTCFERGDVLGLNLSSHVIHNNNLDSEFGREVCCFIDYIINKTSRNILLIPHVMWGSEDDRNISSIIYEQYMDSNRISILDSASLNYCQIRYIISLCRHFIGARTHSVISAYSTCVPAIALGYSVKADGLAKDLGIDSKYVVNYTRCQSGDLLEAYRSLEKDENSIRKHLQTIMPEYKSRLIKAKESIFNFD